nr:hypothetical protein [Sicyoidochytrium minutum DNA virus]
MKRVWKCRQCICHLHYKCYKRLKQHKCPMCRTPTRKKRRMAVRPEFRREIDEGDI